MSGTARTAAALRLYVKLARAARAVAVRTEPRLAAAGLTHTQLGVLEALLHLGPLTQRALIRKLLTSPGNLTDVIDKLEARGLLARCRVATDRRNVEVGLTPEGERFIASFFPQHAADIAASMAALSDEEIATLDGLLRRLGTTAAACKNAATT